MTGGSREGWRNIGIDYVSTKDTLVPSVPWLDFSSILPRDLWSKVWSINESVTTARGKQKSNHRRHRSHIWHNMYLLVSSLLLQSLPVLLHTYQIYTAIVSTAADMTLSLPFAWAQRGGSWAGCRPPFWGEYEGFLWCQSSALMSLVIRKLLLLFSAFGVGCYYYKLNTYLT